jgi:hypothetical protein
VRLRLVVAGLCLVVAALALVLARDVWLWDKAIRDADGRAAVGPVGPGVWAADTILPGDPARSLLRIDDDLDFRRLYVPSATLAVAPPPPSGASPRGPAEAALGRVSRTEPNHVAAAAAANLLGVLLFTDPDDPESSPAERAIGAFQDAVLLDPNNAIAKGNLELILRQLSSNEVKGRSSPGGGDRGGKGGAGLAPGGKGF